MEKQEHTNQEKKGKSRWQRFRKVILSLLSAIIFISAVIMSWGHLTGFFWGKYEKIFPTHTHTYTCYREFIKKRKLEIPEHPSSIPAIVFLQTTFDENAIETKPGIFSATHYMYQLTYTFKSVALEYTRVHSGVHMKKQECVMRLYNEIINMSLTLLPNIREGIVLDFFASKDSVKTAKATLEKIYKDNILHNVESMAATREFRSYGNTVHFTLKGGLVDGLSIGETFDYNNGSNEKIKYKAKEAYNKIYCNDTKPIYEKEDNIPKFVFYPLAIDNYTRKACMECHLLDNYCKNL